MKMNSVVSNFVNSVVKSRREAFPRVRAAKSRTLRLESLEARELLSVNPIETTSAINDDGAAVYEGLAFCAVLDAIDLSAITEEEATNSTTEYEVSNAVTGKTWVVTTTEDKSKLTGSLRYALANASDGDTITFASSLKGETITLNGSQLEIQKSITIDASNIWFSDQDAPGITINGNAKSRHLNIPDSIGEVTIKGVKFENGFSVGNGGSVIIGTGNKVSIANCVFDANKTTSSSDYRSGAIYISGSSTITISDSEFTNNVASHNNYGYYGGGAIYITGSVNATVQNSVFSNNHAANGGGDAIYYVGNSTGRLTISSSTFENNTCYRDEGGGVYATGPNITVSDSTFKSNQIIGGVGRGGGLYVWGTSNSYAQVNNSTFSDNIATGRGGGIYLGYAIISNSTISGNKVTGGGYGYGGGVDPTDAGISNSMISGNSVFCSGAAYGGGIRCNARVRVSNTIITQNNSNYRGGGVYIDGSGIDLSNTEITENTSKGDGGGVYESASYSYRITNSLVSKNTAEGNGGGVYSSSGTMVATNVTIAGNAASTMGGVYLTSNSGLNLYNTIVAENTGGDLSLDAVNAERVTVKNTIWNYDFGTNGNILYEEGELLFKDAGNGDYSLVSGAIAVNAGSDELAKSAGLDKEAEDVKDLGGNPRFFGDSIYIGAYEYNGNVMKAPLAPSNLVFSNYSSSAKTLKMSWTDNSNNETGFVTEYSLDGKTWLRGATTGANVNYRTATGVTSGQTFYFRVASYNASGTSAWTYGNFEAPALIPDAPSALTFSGYSAESKTVKMSWTDNSDNETGFLTQYSFDGELWMRGGMTSAGVNSRWRQVSRKIKRISSGSRPITTRVSPTGRMAS